MHILLSWADIDTIDFSRQCANDSRSTVARLVWDNWVQIRCLIGARVLLKENRINSSKWYKLFLLDSNLQSEWQSHYIDNPRIAVDSALSGFVIDYTRPIIWSNPIIAKEEDKGEDTTYYAEIINKWYYKEWSPEVITWYKGTFTGIFRRIDAFIPGISDYTVTIQPSFKPWDDLIISEIWDCKQWYAHICYWDIIIPINANYIERTLGIEFIQGKKYTFDCKFWNDEWWWYIWYSQYAELPYLSWLITDEDFDPDE